MDAHEADPTGAPSPERLLLTASAQATDPAPILLTARFVLGPWPPRGGPALVRVREGRGRHRRGRRRPALHAPACPTDRGEEVAAAAWPRYSCRSGLGRNARCSSSTSVTPNAQSGSWRISWRPRSSSMPCSGATREPWRGERNLSDSVQEEALRVALERARQANRCGPTSASCWPCRGALDEALDARMHCGGTDGLANWIAGLSFAFDTPARVVSRSTAQQVAKAAAARYGTNPSLRMRPRSFSSFPTGWTRGSTACPRRTGRRRGRRRAFRLDGGSPARRVRALPGSVPLRMALANTVLADERHEEAARIFASIVARAPAAR